MEYKKMKKEKLEILNIFSSFLIFGLSCPREERKKTWREKEGKRGECGGKNIILLKVMMS